MRIFLNRNCLTCNYRTDIVNETVQEINNQEELLVDSKAEDTQEEKTELTKYFCELIDEAGYTPMIYGNKHWLTKEIDLDKLPAGIPVWYAAYQDKPDVSIPFDMWQYSAYGTIDGISTDVDMNIYLKRK